MKTPSSVLSLVPSQLQFSIFTFVEKRRRLHHTKSLNHRCTKKGQSISVVIDHNRLRTQESRPLDYERNHNLIQKRSQQHRKCRSREAECFYFTSFEHHAVVKSREAVVARKMMRTHEELDCQKKHDMFYRSRLFLGSLIYSRFSNYWLSHSCKRPLL